MNTPILDTLQRITPADLLHFALGLDTILLAVAVLYFGFKCWRKR